MLKIKVTSSVFFVISLFISSIIFSQSTDKESIAKAVSGLKFRSIGPAVMGGRIADIAISHSDRSTWYVAVGSGGLWKTINSGITWKPIFDKEQSYSIGTVAIDPNNSNVIWVGTGENVSGRHVGWGDGVYKSLDGGATWKQMGLKKSEHIGKILIDPRNSDHVFVAAEGPLWSSGGDRGLYKTEDGGITWKLVLGIDENTGVTDIEFDPSNPDIIYAAAYQRRRHTWALLAGGPQSGIYKSTNNGSSFRQIKTGLPKGDMGKIGIAVTPANPDLVYATIEANGKEKGFYRSLDKGESWEKRNSYVSGGTGPHYYQEIEASATDPDLVYQMDVFLHVTRDGGKTFNYLGTGREKHSDNHALWIDPNNGKHLIAGTDAGLYETFDEGSKWRHFPNLPVSQFYKLDLDNQSPFYNIVGGAQDLGTLIGPSRTMNSEGVRNQDWYIPLGADGYDSAFDPEDPNIVYMEIQQGLLHRYDRRSEEGLNIQPQAGPNDAPERWNWDSPVLISPHNHKRLYFGSQRLWKSDDQGNSWTAISEDLTTNTNRYELDLMGRIWSVDDLYDNGAMSKYATLTSISESPIEEGLLYTGSDDGLIQVSEDGGENWRKSRNFPKIPARSFINDIEASRHDANIVFAVVDAHKFGDFSPYVLMSSDKGRSWKSISGDLPKGTIVWVIKQDHINENLLFVGTEFGIYFSVNKGLNWIKLTAGVPNIPFRDLELHKRDDDLVGATFGRGFYILDDYSSLRELSKVISKKSNAIFNVRDAWWYVPNAPMQAKGMPTLGSTSYVSDNPEFGALFTYYINELPKTSKQERKDIEKTQREQSLNTPFPGWESLKKESIEREARVLLLVKNDQGEGIRWIVGKSQKGLHRINWDLKLPSLDPISFYEPDFKPPWVGDNEGPLARPGTYSVELYIEHEGKLVVQDSPKTFEVKPVPTNSDETDFLALSEFKITTGQLARQISSANRKLGEADEKLKHMKVALLKVPNAPTHLLDSFNKLRIQLTELRTDLNGDRIRQQKDESTSPSIRSRVGAVVYGHWGTRQNPTETHKENIRLATKDYELFKKDLLTFLNQLESFESTMEAAGAPYTPGRSLK